MSLGTVVEVIGAVVDVEFPRDSVPKINDALKLAWLSHHKRSAHLHHVP